MQPDDSWPLGFIGEVASDGVAHVDAEGVQRVGLREDAVADRVSGEAAFDILLHDERDFGGHG